MNKIILVRYGEIALKGSNRSLFENKLITEIKNAISKHGKFKITKSQSRIYVDPLDEVDYDLLVESMKKVFGIVSLSVVERVETDFDKIKKECLLQAKKLASEGRKTFKVDTKRADKSFVLNSLDTSREVGAYILDNIGTISVDVHKPDFTIYIEVREYSYIYSEIIPATGGMPIGTNGKATLLLSGGIDSPVAGYLMGKRGAIIDAVHFHSHPYTSERAKEKVIELTRILASYCGIVNLYIVPFTDIQTTIYQKCPDEQLTLIMRRIMMNITEKIALANNSNALITGESLGQVASQTMLGLGVTDAAVDLPVFRPLIGFDKTEIIEIARKIGTFETSILPYEDCCTVFVPKHPVTKPRLDKILESEKHVDIENLIEQAINGVEHIVVTR